MRSIRGQLGDTMASENRTRRERRVKLTVGVFARSMPRLGVEKTRSPSRGREVEPGNRWEQD